MPFMHLRQCLFMGLLAVPLIGCFSGRAEHSTAFLESFRPFKNAPGQDMIQMDLAFLEAPVGDAFLNQDLWAQADDQVVPLDRKAILEDNGFRIAQVGGNTPSGLQDRLTSE